MKLFNEALEKTNTILETWEQVLTLAENVDGHRAMIEIPIDERYTLMYIKDLSMVAVIDTENEEGERAVFWYDDGDEWTLGDLVGGYLDLYYPE